MPKRALVQHRPWLLVAAAAATAFYFLQDDPIGGAWLIALKGLGVAALAAYAWYRSRGTDGVLLTAALAFGAAGDVGLEKVRRRQYRRNRRFLETDQEAEATHASTRECHATSGRQSHCNQEEAG